MDALREVNPAWLIAWFWIAWLALVVLMNAVEVAAAGGARHTTLPRSANVSLIQATMLKPGGNSHTVARLLVAAATVWELVCLVLLLLGAVTGDRLLVHWGFGCLFALWAGFLLIGQALQTFVKHPDVVTSHRTLTMLTLLSWLTWSNL